MTSITRGELKATLQALGESQEDMHDWAYADTEGVLRCPDCNSDAEHQGTATFGPLPWSGAVAVTDEVCEDCGVVLSDDGGSAPAYVAYSALRSWDMFGPDGYFGNRDWEPEARQLLAAAAA